MEKKITPNPAQSISSTPAAKPKEPVISPQKLLQFVSGAPALPAKMAADSAKKLTSLLKPQDPPKSQDPSEPPKPPEKNFLHQMWDKAQAQAQQANQARRDLIANAPKQTPSGAAFDPNADVTKLYESGKSKVGTDEKAIKEVMWDRTPEQLKAIAATYNDRYPGRDLWKDLDDEFGKSGDRKMLAALRKGDRVGAASAELVEATTGSTSKDRVQETLGRLTPEEAAQVKQQYAKDHPKGKSIEDWVNKNFHNERKTEVQALLAGKPEQARVAGLQGSLRQKKGDEVVADLRSLKPEEVTSLISNFNAGAKPGEDLASVVSKKLSGTDRDQALALIRGDRATADAALIQDAVDGWGSNKEKLWDGLGTDIADPSERQAYIKQVESAYNRNYGPASSKKGEPLEARLRSELDGENRDKALTLLANGKLPPEKEILYSISGDKKDGMALSKLVQEHGPEAARKMYAEASNGRDLDADVSSRLSGREKFEAEMALKGEPRTTEEKVAAARARAEFENPRKNFDLLQSAAGAFTDADEIMWKNVERSEAALAQLKIAQSIGDEAAIQNWELRVGELTGYAKEDTKVYRGEKDGAVEGAAMVATTVAAVTATVATAGAASPLLAATITAGVGAGTNLAVKSGMQGSAYDWNNAGTDAAWGALEGIGVKGGSVAGKMAREGVEQAVKAGTKRTVLAATAEGMVDGAVGGAISGASDTALAEGTWDNSLLDGLGKVAQGGAVGGAFGGAVGGVTGRPAEFLTEKAGQAISKIMPGKAPAVGNTAGKTFADVEAPDARARLDDLEGTSATTTMRRLDPDAPAGAASPAAPVRTTAAQPEVRTSGSERLDYDRSRVETKLKDIDARYGEELKLIQAKREAEMKRIDERLAANPGEPVGEARKKALEPTELEKEVVRKQAQAILDEAGVTLDKAVAAGRIDPLGSTLPNNPDSEKLLLQNGVAMAILRDLRNRPDLPLQGRVVKEISQFVYMLQEHKGFDEVRKALKIGDDVANFDGDTGRQLVANRLTEARRFSVGGLDMTANRAIEKAPTTVLVDGHEVRLYNAGAADTEVAREAMARVRETAPEIVPDIQEIHYEKLVDTKVAHTNLNPEAGALTMDKEMTLGKVKTDSHSGAMVMKKGGTYTSDTNWQRAAIAKEVTAEIKDLERRIEFNENALGYEGFPAQARAKMQAEIDEARRLLEGGPDAVKAKVLKDKPELSGPMPEFDRPINQQSHTIFHEGAHSFDKRNGWKSETGEWGPFGQKDGKFSRSGPTDYLTHYAQDHVDDAVRASEDFAETVATVANFPFLKEKPELGPLTPVAVEKVRRAGRLVGIPEADVEAFIAYYGRVES